MIKIEGRQLNLKRVRFNDGSEIENEQGYMIDGFLWIEQEETMMCFNLAGIDFMECGKIEAPKTRSVFF